MSKQKMTVRDAACMVRYHLERALSFAEELEFMVEDGQSGLTGDATGETLDMIEQVRDFESDIHSWYSDSVLGQQIDAEDDAEDAAETPLEQRLWMKYVKVHPAEYGVFLPSTVARIKRKLLRNHAKQKGNLITKRKVA